MGKRTNRHFALPGLRQAFTLVEALLAASILAIVAASATLPFVAGAHQLNVASEYEHAVELGEELMEEIIARPFYAPGESSPSPGPEAGETNRRLYNSVDDFEGYSEYKGSGTKYHMTDYKGDDVTEDDFEDYWRSSKVTFVTFPNQTEANCIVRIDVNVYRGSTKILTTSRLKVREY